MSNNQLLIRNIKNLIREKGIKQYVVAEKAGFSPNNFSAMLNERKIITAEHIPNIARALGVTVNDLYERGSE